MPPPGIGSALYPEGILGFCGVFEGGVNFWAGFGGFFIFGQQVVGDLGGALLNRFAISRSNFNKAPMIAALLINRLEFVGTPMSGPVRRGLLRPTPHLVR